MAPVAIRVVLIVIVSVVVNDNFAADKVYLNRRLVVDATEVTHKHAVDIDPYVIVAREVIGNRLATLSPIGSRIATVLLNKTS